MGEFGISTSCSQVVARYYPYFPLVENLVDQEYQVYPCMGAPNQLGYTSLVMGVGLEVKNFLLHCILYKYRVRGLSRLRWLAGCWDVEIDSS